MKNLSVLTDSAITYYDAITESKTGLRKARLFGFRPRISSRYDEYLSLSLELERIAASDFSGADAEDLIHCYSTRTQALDALKAKIRNSQSEYGRCFCAYCGINNPDTIEHYLPKRSFPEFSVLHQNLLPACSECNRLKGDSWKASQGRSVLHFYFDYISSNQKWLLATVEIDNNTPLSRFSLVRPSDMSVSGFQLIGSHYSSLDLLNRYSQRAGELFSEVRSSMHPGLSHDDLINELKHRSDGLVASHGRNHWKVALLEAMAESSEYINSFSV